MSLHKVMIKEICGKSDIFEMNKPETSHECRHPPYKSFLSLPKPRPVQLLAELGVKGKLVVVVLLFYVHGKHLRSCRDGQLT